MPLFNPTNEVSIKGKVELGSFLVATPYNPALLNVNSLHPDVGRWVSRVRDKGGSIRNEFLLAHDAFINELDRLVDGVNLWEKMKSQGLILTFGTDDFKGVTAPLVCPEGVDPVSVGFVPNDYASNRGLDPGIFGQKKVINTGFKPRIHLIPSDTQISVYSRTPQMSPEFPIEYPAEVVCRSADRNIRLIMQIRLERYSNGGALDFYNTQENSGARKLYFTASSGVGLFSGQSTSSRIRFYRNSSLVSDKAPEGYSSFTDDAQVSIFGEDSSSFSLLQSGRTLSYVYIGKALTQIQETAHYQAVNNMQILYGRNVA